MKNTYFRLDKAYFKSIPRAKYRIKNNHIASLKNRIVSVLGLVNRLTPTHITSNHNTKEEKIFFHCLFHYSIFNFKGKTQMCGSFFDFLPDAIPTVTDKISPRCVVPFPDPVPDCNG